MKTTIQAIEGYTIGQILQLEKQFQKMPEFKFNYINEKQQDETVEQICQEILQ